MQKTNIDEPKIYTYYPEVKNFQIDTFEELKDNLGYLSEEEIKKIEKAYLKAEELHRNSPPRVSSKKPYITHPLSVANLIASYHGNCNLICAALLHDTVEDTDYTIEQLAEDFGDDVAAIVDTVTKIGTAKDGIEDKVAAKDATHRKILESVSKYGINGILGILLKIADRFDNIQSLDKFDYDKRHRISLETLQIYVPLARIAGVYEAKDFFENAALFNIDQEMFEKYYFLRQNIKESANDLCNEFCSLAGELLEEKNISFDFEIKVKNLYGIYKQIEERGKSLEQIKDIIGMKFIVPNLDDCYTTLGVVHACGKPIKGYFDDYIATPKANGYRSINTLVEYKNSNIQARIRSEKMERCNRLGLLNKDNPSADKILENMQSHVTAINGSHPTDKEFILKAEQEILRPKIIIRAPTGKRVEMYDGQSALDYALQSNLVDSVEEIDRIYVNERRLYNFNEPLCDEDLVYVLRKES